MDLSSEWTAEQMLELGWRHARLEAERDLDGVMATLVPEPVYEFHPLGLRLCGGERVRRYYAQFFSGFLDQVVGYELLEEWVSERSVAQEYDIRVAVGAVGDGEETHRVLGILQAEGDRLGGERIYGSERIVRLMLGELFRELEPFPSLPEV